MLNFVKFLGKCAKVYNFYYKILKMNYLQNDEYTTLATIYYIIQVAVNIMAVIKNAPPVNLSTRYYACIFLTYIKICIGKQPLPIQTIQIHHRNPGNFGECFFREICLMRCNQHIGKGH